MTDSTSPWRAGRLAASLLLLIAAPWAGAEETPPGYRIEGFEWTSPPAFQGEVEAINPYGDLRARCSEDDRVYVQAVIQKFTPEHDGFDIRVSERAEGVRVEVFLPPETARGKARVDLSVMLPKDCGLRLATDFGGVVANRLKNPVKARTGSGKIKVDSAWPVELESESGFIDARLTASAWPEGSTLRSRRGGIGLQLASDAELELRATAGGGSSIDCSQFRSACRAAQHDRTLTVVLGGGGGILNLSTEEGKIAIGGVAVPRPANPSKTLN